MEYPTSNVNVWATIDNLPDDYIIKTNTVKESVIISNYLEKIYGIQTHTPGSHRVIMIEDHFYLENYNPESKWFMYLPVLDYVKFMSKVIYYSESAMNNPFLKSTLKNTSFQTQVINNFDPIKKVSITKDIEFAKLVSKDLKLLNPSAKPSDYKNVELLQRDAFYVDGINYDLMFAYMETKENGIKYLGKFNDGIVS